MRIASYLFPWQLLMVRCKTKEAEAGEGHLLTLHQNPLRVQAELQQQRGNSIRLNEQRFAQDRVLSFSVERTTAATAQSSTLRAERHTGLALNSLNPRSTRKTDLSCCRNRAQTCPA